MSRFHRWYRITARRKGRLIVVSLAGFALALIASRFLPRVYEARTLISVRPAAVVPEPSAESGGLPGAVLRSPGEEIARFEFLSEVLSRQPQLSRHYARRGEARPDLARLRRNIRVESRGEGRFEITGRNPDAALARELANAIAAGFAEEVSARHRLRYEQSLAPLEQKRQALDKALRDKGEQLDAFRFKNRDFLLEEGAIERQIAEREAELRKLEERLALESRQLEILQAKLAETPRIIESRRSTEPDPEYRMLQGELSVLQLRRDRLLLRYTEKHPAVEALSGEIEECERQLAVLKEAAGDANVVESVNPLSQLLQERQTEQELGLEQLRARLESERKVLAELEQKNAMRAGIEREYGRLMEEYQTLEREQEALLARIGALQDEAAASGEPVQVLAWATLPGKPLGPGWAGIVPAALGVGVILGLASVFAAERLDRSLRTGEQARAALNVPVLGTIPLFGTEEK